MLDSLHAARFLTAEQLEWLHFPTWRERYVKWQAEQAEGSSRYYTPSTLLYGRLRRMEAERLVRRIVRPVAMAISSYKRDADLWTLAERGGELLVEHAGYDRNALDIPDVRPRAFQTITHSAEIGRVYAALRARIEAKAGLRIADWRNDQQTKREYDRIAARIPQGDGSSVNEPLPVQPDGVIKLNSGERDTLLLIEVERDRPPQSWMRKVYAWEAYRGSAELRARYGTASFALLAFSLTAAQRDKLMETTAQALLQLFDGDLGRVRTAANAYLFAALPDAHPTRIGDQWRRIGIVSARPYRLPSGEIQQRVVVEGVTHTLIT